MTAPAVRSYILAYTLTPFLYPCLHSATPGFQLVLRNTAQTGARQVKRHAVPSLRCLTTASTTPSKTLEIDVTQYDHLDPKPPDYSTQPFVDACALTIHAGSGGHGCISFLREKYVPNGPPNGGDGGTGGNVYIQAVRGETSLHKLARRPILKAGRGNHGEGSMRGGKRGEDVLITVPVGTVVREISRIDPLDEQERSAAMSGFGRDLVDDEEDTGQPDRTRKWRRDKWLLYPGTLPLKFTTADFPALPRPRRSQLSSQQLPAPIRIDLDKPTEMPVLLAAGAMGGFGNPHFVAKSIPRPKFATKGEVGVQIRLQLELKLLADIGLVGLPNAGKSTLLRALTRSRTRVGSWAFTTLAPSIGTIVLDSHTGRPVSDVSGDRKDTRTNLTIADIPGLIEDAHLDRGLGLGFLRHVERAAVLAFVIDLSAGDAVVALKALWREISAYEDMRESQVNADSQQIVPDEQGMLPFQPFSRSEGPGSDAGSRTPTSDEEETSSLLLNTQKGRHLPPLSLPPISSKPWFVVATKADLPDTQENFLQLRDYLAEVQAGNAEPPCGRANAWRRKLLAIPASPLNKEGVDSIPEVVLNLLNG